MAAISIPKVWGINPSLAVFRRQLTARNSNIAGWRSFLKTHTHANHSLPRTPRTPRTSRTQWQNNERKPIEKIFNKAKNCTAFLLFAYLICFEVFSIRAKNRWHRQRQKTKKKNYKNCAQTKGKQTAHTGILKVYSPNWTEYTNTTNVRIHESTKWRAHLTPPLDFPDGLNLAAQTPPPSGQSKNISNSHQIYGFLSVYFPIFVIIERQ